MDLCSCGEPWNSDGVCLTHQFKGDNMIIAFAGKMGSGKDTAADFLKQEGFEALAFADNLKEMAMDIFRLSKEQCYDQEMKMKPLKDPITLSITHISKVMVYAEQKNGFTVDKDAALKLYKLIDDPVTLNTPREVLQYLGTEILRECIDPNYHALVVKHKIDSRSIQKVAITDCRFPNERMFVKKWGGKTVLIDRPSEAISTTSGLSGHASENSLGQTQEYDVVIKNDTTLNALKENVLALVR
jgi:hypothetical protein